MEALNEAKRLIAVKKMEEARLTEAQQLSASGMVHSGSNNSLAASSSAVPLPNLTGYLLRYTEGFFYNCTSQSSVLEKSHFQEIFCKKSPSLGPIRSCGLFNSLYRLEQSLF